MKLNLAAREQRSALLIGILGLVTLYIYAAYLVRPLQRRGRELGEQVSTARQRVGILERSTSNEAALREQYRQLEETVKFSRTRLPGEEELPAVIELLSDLAGRSQVKIQTIFPQRSLMPDPAAATAAVYKDVLIQIDALAGYHQLGTFLGLVEAHAKPMRVASLRIATNPKEPKRQFVKLLIRAYFSGTTDQAAEGRPGAGQAAPGPAR